MKQKIPRLTWQMPRQQKLNNKLKTKSGSTLVMVVLLFAFVLILGGGIVMMASMSSRQSVNTLGNKQADYTAKSVLDAVIAQIQAGNIDPAQVAANTILDCGGHDDILGDYTFSIRKYDDGQSIPNLYKISVAADYADSKYKSEMYSIIQRVSGEEAESKSSDKFQEIALSTAYDETGNDLNAAQIYGEKGDLILNNGKDLSMGGGGRVAGDLKVKGNLSIGQFAVGTDGKDTVVETEGNLTISGTSAVVNSDLYSEKAITLSGGATINGDVRANNDIAISNGVKLAGTVYTNGNISTSGGNNISGDMYSNGNVTVAASTVITGNIYADGNVVVNGTVSGNIFTHGSITITNGTVSGESVIAAGDIVLTGFNHTNNTISIISKGSVYFVGGNSKANVMAYANIVLGANQYGSGYGSTLNGALLAKGNVTVFRQSNVTADIASMGNVLLQDWSTIQTGEIITNGSVTIQNATHNGIIVAQKDFTLNQNASGDARIGGYASITGNRLTGNLWSRGGGYFPNAGCVSGTIYLSGPYTGAATGNNVAMVDASGIELPDPLMESDFNFWQDIDLPLERPLVDVEIDTDPSDWVGPEDELADMREVQANIVFRSNGANYRVEGNDYIIEQNCTLTLSNYTSNGGTKQVVFDTTKLDKDLYILLKDPKGGSNVSIQDGVDFLTKGDHNVFIFLDDSETGGYVNLSVGANCFFGYYDDKNGILDSNRTPNLYIVSNSGSSVQFASNSSLYGFIYAPYGTVTMSGSPVSSSFTYKMYGAVVASKIAFQSNLKFMYYEPKLTEEESGGGEESSGDTENTKSWAVIGTYVGGGAQ